MVEGRSDTNEMSTDVGQEVSVLLDSFRICVAPTDVDLGLGIACPSGHILSRSYNVFLVWDCFIDVFLVLHGGVLCVKSWNSCFLSIDIELLRQYSASFSGLAPDRRRHRDGVPESPAPSPR